jgi:membrane-associated phospholipid phosphatase
MNPETASAASPSGPWRRWGREACIVWRMGWSRLVSRLWIIAFALGLGAGFVLMDTGIDQSMLQRVRIVTTNTVSITNELDQSVSQEVRIEGNELADDTADFLSTYSDLNLCVPLTLALWIAGVVWRKKQLRRLALACLMATLMAGFIVIIFRAGLGRPRPKAELADGFYGPHLRDSDYQSFPSGHAGTSFGTGGTFLAAVPWVGVPATLYAGGVAWSRMQDRRHHPVDVTVGAVIGLTCGLSFGSAVPGARIRLKRRRRRRRRRNQVV